MEKFIMSLINFKNMVMNSIFVRVIWTIIGLIGGALGFTWILCSCDHHRMEDGRKPLFLRKEWYTKKESPED